MNLLEAAYEDLNNRDVKEINLTCWNDNDRRRAREQEEQERKA